MSQTLVDFSGNPSGAELMDDYLTPLQDNILTSNSGTTRPTYAKEGTKWIDKTQTPWLLKLYDGSQDIILGEINPTTHSFVPTDPMTTAGDLIVEGTSGIPVRLAAGTAGHVLTSNGPGALPSYQLGVYANTDLSNLTSTGQGLFNAKKDLSYENQRVVQCNGATTVQLADNDEVISLVVNAASTIQIDASLLTFPKNYYTVQFDVTFPAGVQTVTLVLSNEGTINWINALTPDFSSGKEHWLVLRAVSGSMDVTMSDAGEVG